MEYHHLGNLNVGYLPNFIPRAHSTRLFLIELYYLLLVLFSLPFIFIQLLIFFSMPFRLTSCLNFSIWARKQDHRGP